MRCPACGNTLSQKIAGSITVDACEGGCGGIWFDNFELKKVDEPDETAGEILLAIDKTKAIEVDQNKKRHCPRCETIIMMKHFFSVKRQVLVDECPKCGGFWLDAGELAAIRQQFSSEEVKESVAEEYLSDVFDSYLATRLMRRQS